MTRTTVAAALMLASAALAHPKDGPPLTAELDAWFTAQHSAQGAWCCDLSDSHLLPDNEWRMVADHYEVRIQGAWHPITPGALRDPKGGANPTGYAVIWYLADENGLRIYCFAPGQLY